MCSRLSCTTLAVVFQKPYAFGEKTSFCVKTQHFIIKTEQAKFSGPDKKNATDTKEKREHCVTLF